MLSRPSRRSVRLPGYDYEQHLGGVYYLFLRGMGIAPDSSGLGVYFDRPSAAHIDALDRYLTDNNTAVLED